MSEPTRIEALERRMKADPAAVAFAALAEEYRRAGRLDEAVNTCRAGLARHPNYVSARVTLGRALLDQGQLEDARHELEAVLRVAPENLAAVRGLADIHRRRGELAEALEQLGRALVLAPQDRDLQETVNELEQAVAPATPPPEVPVAAVAEPPGAAPVAHAAAAFGEPPAPVGEPASEVSPGPAGETAPESAAVQPIEVEPAASGVALADLLVPGPPEAPIPAGVPWAYPAPVPEAGASGGRVEPAAPQLDLAAAEGPAAPVALQPTPPEGWRDLDEEAWPSSPDAAVTEAFERTVGEAPVTASAAAAPGDDRDVLRRQQRALEHFLSEIVRERARRGSTFGP